MVQLILTGFVAFVTTISSGMGQKPGRLERTNRAELQQVMIWFILSVRLAVCAPHAVPFGPLRPNFLEGYVGR